MSVDVTCGKCGEKIASMRTLKSIKDVMSPHAGKCPSCGQRLSASEFSMDATKS